MEDDSSEECGESGSEASDGSLYIPTPERTSASRIMGNVSPIALPNEVGFIELSQLYQCHEYNSEVHNPCNVL